MKKLKMINAKRKRKNGRCVLRTGLSARRAAFRFNFFIFRFYFLLFNSFNPRLDAFVEVLSFFCGEFFIKGFQAG
jgi:hypothetical protein